MKHLVYRIGLWMLLAMTCLLPACSETSTSPIKKDSPPTNIGKNKGEGGMPKEMPAQ